MRRLSGMDTAFLYLETPTTHMQVQAVMLLDPSTVPGGYSFEKIKAHLASRLPQLPEFRRRLAFVPFDLHRPVWFDDPDFDLDYHVRHIAVPAPGTPEQLADIVGDIAGRPLDRARPLWEFWVIEGVENGAVAVVARMHHATIDGVSGSSLLTSILDLEALPGRRVAPTSTTGSPSTSRPTSSSCSTRSSRGCAGRCRSGSRWRCRTCCAARSASRGRGTSSRPSGGTPFDTPRTPWNAPLTPHRRVAFASVPLDEVKAMKNAFGCTVNDIVLATATGALRRYLRALRRGARPAVARRVPGLGAQRRDRRHRQREQGLGDVRVAADAPRRRRRADRAHPRRARRARRKSTRRWARARSSSSASSPARAASGSRAGCSVGSRAAARVPINLVISNVPGPPFPLYLARRAAGVDAAARTADRRRGLEHHGA